MSTLILKHSFPKKQLIKSIINSIKLFFNEQSDSITVDYSAEIYSNVYRVMVLENKWVKNVTAYINWEELIEILPPGNYSINKIDKEIEKNGICRIKKRLGLFKKMEFDITGIWDYE